MKNKKLSKYISYLLRHHPETLNLNMDNNGYVFVKEFIEKINETKEWKNYLTLEKLEDIVNNDEKQRYSFNENKTKIRAAQGHSFPVDTLKEAVPPNILYHGTALKSLDSIKENGLKPQTRQYVHLSTKQSVAFEVGIRPAKKKENVVMLEINTIDMLKDEFKFYVADNGVWLVREIPFKYICIVN